VEDARVPKLRSVVGKPGQAVEAGRVDLRVQPGDAKTAPAGLGQQCVQQRLPDPAAAHPRQHCHTSDLDSARLDDVEPPRPDRFRVE